MLWKMYHRICRGVISKFNPQPCWKWHVFSVECSDLILFTWVRFLSVPGFSSEASQKIPRFLVSFHTAFKLQVGSRVPVSCRSPCGTICIDTRPEKLVLNSLWGPGEGLTHTDFTALMFGTGGVNLEPIFKVKLLPKCVKPSTATFYANTKIQQSEFFQSALVHIKPSGRVTAPWELSIEIQTDKTKFRRLTALNNKIKI